MVLFIRLLLRSMFGKRPRNIVALTLLQLYTGCQGDLAPGVPSNLGLALCVRSQINLAPGAPKYLGLAPGVPAS